ncbi:hypothetical protein [Hymenobacter volaticus]|uniref:NERD domain-containing protein n=1 Tax=Hymenobacter volaticus TaxID=2932254 RepID=A0ABY4G2R9_9BACT|nr:hypothetical protein [Hymenobacter volaticus]UOQ64869.1 hypothetical protein MUN86_15000 [Hymenobacter volaticus]
MSNSSIKEKSKKPFLPASSINYSTICRVITEAWPEGIVHETSDLNQVKSFHNKSFDKLRAEFDSILNRCHPASWALEAYRQIAVWTMIYHMPKSDVAKLVGESSELAPIGRYGWRYVTEKAIEKLNGKFTFKKLKPDEQDLNDMFTVLAGMITSSESSNFLHHLKDILKSSYLVFSPSTIQDGFIIRDNKDRALYKNIASYLTSDGHSRSDNPISPHNPVLLAKIDSFLSDNFKFTLEIASKLSIDILEKICGPISAEILVQPYEEAIDFIVSASGISRESVKGFLEFIALNASHPFYEPRDFLRKSQSVRLLNYCGIVLNLSDNLEAIYDDATASHVSITSSKTHLIISPTAISEWLNTFIYKLVSGQRSDLKKYKGSAVELAEIERYYHEDIFEQETKKLLESNNYMCIINLKKVNKKDLSCGEIDIIAFDRDANAMLVIECKNLATIVDARGMGQVINDHFNQKKYHYKFLKKIDWVLNNYHSVASVFKLQHGIDLKPGYSINQIFVTSSPNVVKFLVSEYWVMTFFELRAWLNKNK